MTTHPQPAPSTPLPTAGPLPTSTPLLQASPARRAATRRGLLVLAGATLAVLALLAGFLTGYALDVLAAR